jgi:protein regulator of cytokinesis 1
LQNFWQEKISDGKLHVLKYKVKKLRDEIEVWWEKCFLREEEKQKFKDYKSTTYTPELYECHVEELKRLKRKFYRNEALYLLIKKHQDTWKCVVNMDNHLYNRERLFQNRGAQLLQEERDRRAAQKELPRLEEVINKETELYEREHGRPFLIYGECFSDMISHQKEQHKESQNLLKSARKKGEHCATTSDLPKMTTSLSKLKKKLGNNTQSPAETQTKRARVTSCDKLASRSADVCHSKLGLPVRRKLIVRNVHVPVKQP